MDPIGHPDQKGPTAASPSTVADELSPTARQVAEYLKRHPDFLADHDELLAVLTPPAHRRGDNVVDLQHFALRRMQEDLAQTKRQHQALLATSRSNLASQARIHAAVLAVIGARSFEQLITTVVSDLAMLLDLDVVTLCIESEADPEDRPRLPGVLLLPPGTVDAIIGRTREIALFDHAPGTPEFFGGGAGLVQSQGLLRLNVGPEAPAGLIALGARSPTRFKPGQGSELLSFLARALELTLAEWLHIEP
jgi:uncharacterized protein YigA (DUF484 family)